MKIRKASTEDLDVLVGFMVSMAKGTEDLELDPKVLKPSIEAALLDEQKGVYYIAEIKG